MIRKSRYHNCCSIDAAWLRVLKAHSLTAAISCFSLSVKCDVVHHCPKILSFLANHGNGTEAVVDKNHVMENNLFGYLIRHDACKTTFVSCKP